jgi:hypothetical protein
MDPAGRLFWWGGQLYRGIDPEWTPLFQQLFRDGLIQRLVDQGLLIETELAPYAFESYDMVVRHRVLPFLSYPYEWCSAMFKDGALATLDLALYLSERGYTLKDPLPWNLSFDSSKPVYLDLLSLRRLGDDRSWVGYEDFCQFWLRPLSLMSNGLGHIAQLLLWAGTGVSKSDLPKFNGCSESSQLIPSVKNRLRSILRVRVPDRYRRMLSRGSRAIQSSLPYKKPRGSQVHVDFLRNLRRKVTDIDLPINQKVRSPHVNGTSSSPAERDSAATEATLREILARLHPSSVLGIGSGSGRYSKLAAQCGSDVVFFDSDPLSVTEIYNEASRNHLPILPVVMDFVRPTPSCGPSSHWSVAAGERFQCDMVLVLGLLHYIVRDLYFAQIVEGLASFSKKWLVVEFVPPEDGRMKSKWWSARIPWYTLDNFITSLRQRFRDVSTLQSHRGPGVLLLCEK